MRSEPGWNLHYTDFTPGGEKLREALCTIGNGYFGTRGAYEGSRAGDVHYPGTYFAGVYNRLPSTVHGKVIYNDDLVNCPNWLPIEIRIGESSYRNPLEHELVEYEQNLDMRTAVMKRRFRFKDVRGRITEIASRRFASMADQHTAAISFTVTPINYSAPITVRSSLDGTVRNQGVPRYSHLSNEHLTPVNQGKTDQSVYLTVKTNESHIQIVMCARAAVYVGDDAIQTKRRVSTEPGWVGEELGFQAKQGTPYRVEKMVCAFTSQDENMANAEDSAFAKIDRLTTFQALLAPHMNEWSRLWHMADVRIDGDDFCQKVVRLHIYHLLTTASRHNVHIDAGIPARGLHGEAYRGHIFWDHLFVLPFHFRRFNEIARAALMYRYRRLDAARMHARDNGYKGAMYPWQTSSDGHEETQVIHFNPVSGQWDPDLSCRQRHVSIAVFVSVWEYYKTTKDTSFLSRFGAEMMIEIARFWADIARQGAKNGIYHIRGVMGPDEFHEKYPGSKRGGLDDNAYTNVMVVWLLERTMQVIKELPSADMERICTRTVFDLKEMELWRDITHKIHVPITKEGIISQYENYMKLKELDWDHYREKYGNIQRMDRILKSEGDSPDRYKVSKQADVLMLFFVIPPSDVIRILRRLGHHIPNSKEFLRRNYEYYEGRTSHGSTLSKIVHAAISRDMGMGSEKMWDWFMQALESDINDTQGGTTLEGIHVGVMAGTINIIVRVIAGVHIGDGSLDIDPQLPPHWKRLAFKMRLRGAVYSFDITKEKVNFVIDSEGGRPMVMRISRTGK